MPFTFSYSSGVRLCFWTSSGVMAGSIIKISKSGSADWMRARCAALRMGFLLADDKQIEAVASGRIFTLWPDREPSSARSGSDLMGSLKCIRTCFRVGGRGEPKTARGQFSLQALPNLVNRACEILKSLLCLTGEQT